MKAKCPDCFGNGPCDKCTNGFVEVHLKEGGEWWTRVCQNQEECGFVNGGCWTEGLPPLESSGKCVKCDGMTNWLLLADAPEEQAWQKPENYIKWQALERERTVCALREKLKETRALALKILNGKQELTLDECKLLDICRICKKPQSTPFTYGYGAEFAHTKCLEKGSPS